MRRYHSLLRRAWAEAGFDVHVGGEAGPLSSRWSGGVSKWLGYVEKFVLSARSIRAAARSSDLVHIADHSDAIWSLLLPRDTVVQVTCHDLFAVRAALGEIPEHRPGASGRVYQWLVRRGLRRATRLLAVSDTTAEDVRRLVGQNVVVVRSPVDPFLLQQDSSDEGLDTPRDFVLVVAGHGWRKRRDLAIRLWGKLRCTETFSETNLLVVGPPLTSEEVAIAGQDGRFVTVLSEVTDSKLSVLYRHARAVLVMSRYEGFAWPIVEAQSCGAPVLCADVPILRETGGTGACYVPEGTHDRDWDAIALELISVGLREQARANLMRFSWTGFVAQLASTLDLSAN
jgi:glycosyltransferase involved in cell wall biosynthesis